MRRSMEQPYLPRSSLPRCSRVIFTFSASFSCVIPLIFLSSFRRFPNASWSKYMSCPFRRAGEDFVSVRSGQVCGSCKQSKRKSTVEIESLKGYGSPFIRFGFVRCMVVSQSRAPRAAPLTRLKVVCVIRLYVFGFYCAVTAF